MISIDGNLEGVFILEEREDGTTTLGFEITIAPDAMERLRALPLAQVLGLVRLTRTEEDGDDA